MRLVHFRPDPIQNFLATLVRQDVTLGGPENDGPVRMKPANYKALWISDEDEDGWSEWCISNDHHIEGLRYVYEINLKDDPGICWIRNNEELHAFNEEFRGPPIHPSSSIQYLDWGRVQEAHSAVIVTPYLWEMRNDTNCFWYYTWDCASGVVLDPACIESIGDPVETDFKDWPQFLYDQMFEEDGFRTTPPPAEDGLIRERSVKITGNVSPEALDLVDKFMNQQ